MRNKRFFLKFFLFACACLMCALPAKADDPDWASMGAAEGMMGFMGEYYLYNVGENAFLGASEVTTDPQEAVVYTMMPVFNELYAVTGENIFYTDANSVNHYLAGENATCWYTDVKSVSYSSQGNNQYRLYTDATMMQSYLKVASNALTLCMYMPSMPEYSPCTPDASCNWVFIPKATFEAALAAMAEPEPDPEPESQVIADGWYYIYNNTSHGYMRMASANVDKVQAVPYYVKKVDGGYSIAYQDNGTVKFFNPSTPSTAGATTLVVSQIDKKSEGIFYLHFTKMNNNVEKRFYTKSNSNGNSVTTQAIPTSDLGSTPVDALCEWQLIPIADYIPDVVDNDTYLQTKFGTISNKKHYYLYNLGTKYFLTCTSTSLGQNNDPKLAEPFYIRELDGGKYEIVTSTNAPAIKYIQASKDFASSSVALTLTPLTENGKTRYTISDNNNKYLTSNKGNTTLSLKTINPSASNAATYYPYSATIAANDVHAQWVLIAKEDYPLSAPDDPDESDEWAQRGTTELGNGGRFYLYNPASKYFIAASGVNKAASSAYPLTIDKVSETSYAMVRANMGYTTTVTPTIQYVTNKGGTAASVTNFTIERIGSTKSYRICNADQYYFAMKRTGGTSGAYTYSMFVGNNAGENVFAYIPDALSEWVLIPDSVYERIQTPTPNPEEEDVYAIGGVEPESGKSYKLYNVHSKRFVQGGSLTNVTLSADDCPITIYEGIGVVVKNANNQSVFGNPSYGYSTGNVCYTLEPVDEEQYPGQYYLYQTVGNYDIHLRANHSSVTGYQDYEIIRHGADKSAMSRTNRWVFLTSQVKYYQAKAEIFAGDGTLHVSFVPSAIDEAGATTDVDGYGSLGTYVMRQATFKAEPASGYQFMGWKVNPEEDFISTDAEYTYTFNVSSTDEEHPDVATLYAYFEDKDAEVYNQAGILQGEYASFAAAQAAASKGHTIKLKRNITTAQTINISKGVIIDFNGYTITNSEVVTDATNLVTITSTDTVTFKDGTIKQEGGIVLTACSSSSPSAIAVTSGTLVINSGNYTTFQCWSNANNDAFVINRTGGKVCVNGGYYRSYTNDGSSLWYQSYQKEIFKGSTDGIKLYGGYFGGNCDYLWDLYPATHTKPVDENIRKYLAQDMELMQIDFSDVCTNPYIYQIQSASLNENVVATANDKKFTSLADAIAYANNNAESTVIIRLAKDCQLEAGTYVIPEKATLIVPYNSLHTEPLISCPLLNSTQLPKKAYRTLTLEDGVHMDVYGAIELGGRAYSYGNGAQGTGRPNSDYGQMIMNQGSEIVLNNGAVLRAWGYVTGEGTIDVRRGAAVNEMFQVYDFKGGKGTLAMFYNDDPGPGEKLNTHKAFPINQYYIQNVEVKTTYRPGASLWGAMAAVNVGVMVKIIGVDVDGAALFKMNNKDDSEDTWVRKWYNPASDQQVYDINNSAAISNLKLPLSGVIGVEGADFDSKDYILPITNNFKIHVLAGQIDITQDVAFLPGAELEIDKQCYGNIPDTAIVYLYDADQWGAYVYNNVYASKIKYRPGGLQYNRNISSAAGLGDAKMNIHGTLEVDGGFRTTEGGANIFSTNADAGTVSFKEHALTTYEVDRDTLDTWTHQVYHSANADNGHNASADPYYVELAAKPAKLQNAEGDPTSTLAAGVDESFCYINNEWRKMNDDGCGMVHDDDDNYFIKPQQYVQIGAEDENHLYHDVNNPTRDFIVTFDGDGNCQWWEVEDVDGLKHSLHPENDVYYYYDDVTYDAWVEKRFTIIWKNWDGAIIDTCEMKKGATLQYLGSIPNREKTAYYTYDFAGWSPAIAPDAVVSGDATYTAQFNQTDRMYIITFQESNGTEIETQYKKMGEIPACTVEGKPGDDKVWSPAISAVTGDASYKVADPSSSPYTIRFVNWDGTDLINPQEVTAGEIPEYTGTTPIKPSLGDENYTFIGWTPDIAAAAADAIYVATFEAEHITGLNVTNALTINDNREVDEVHVKTTGTLDIAAGKSLTTENFYLEASESASGQVLTQTGLTVTGNVYFDLILNTPARHWHAFGVPWAVDLNTNALTEVETGRTFVLGHDYDIIYYNGAKRAAEGPGASCWEYVEHNSHILQPGQGYMIAFTSDVQTLRFTKKADAPVIYNGDFAVAANNGGAATDNGINAIANPMAYHATLDVAGVAQVHDGGEIGSDGYDPVTIANMRYIVGKTVYVQVDAAQSIVVEKAGSSVPVVAAPARKVQKTTDKKYLTLEDYYTVELTNTNGLGSKLYVLPEEDKADEYVIGHDLVKMGMSTKKAQIWINRYGANLGLNTTAPMDGIAEYPISVYAPSAGEYTISNIQSPISDEEYVVYLTQDGEAIWNLSESAYTIDLAAGVNKTYGLRLSAHKAPTVVTGVDEAVVDAQGETRKVLIDNQVFIIRGNKVYTIDGKMVK